MGGIIIKDKCEFIDKCGFFLNYQGNSDFARNGWIKLFCENLEWSEECERKKYRESTGKPPADNMAPNGSML